MGGKGSGGRRVGAGRKSQNQATGELKGSRRARARVKAQSNSQNAGNQSEPSATAAQAAPGGEVQIPDPPGSLTLDELAEWNDLAPRALKEGTLTDATRLALRDLCQARVLKDRLLRTIGDQGDVVLASSGNLAAHPLLTRFTTLFQRVEAGMVRFRLAPMGKDMTESEKPADAFAEFDGAAPAADRTTH